MAQTIRPKTGESIDAADVAAAWKQLSDDFVVSGYTYDSASGLDVTIAAGEAMISGFRIVDDASLSAITVADDTTSWIYLTSSGTLSTNTTGTTPANAVPLVRVIAASGSITSNTDIRPTRGSGSLSLIQSQNIPSAVASVDFTARINGDFKHYVLLIDGLEVATDGASLYLRTSTDAGVNWDSGVSDYGYTRKEIHGDGTDRALQWDDSAAEIVMADGVGNAAGETLGAKVEIYDPASAVPTLMRFDTTWIDSSGVLREARGGAQRVASADVTGIRILASSGNIDAGRITLYGIKHD